MARRIVARTKPGGGVEVLEQATDAQKASFSEALATRSPPLIGGTDSLWFRGRFNGDPFGDAPRYVKDNLHKQARELGISLTGKEYNLALVRPEYRGKLDPEALVGTSASDVRRVVESHPEWDSEGMVDQVGREPEAEPDFTYHVRDDLVEEAVVEDMQSAGVERLNAQQWNDLKEAKRTQFEGDPE